MIKKINTIFLAITLLVSVADLVFAQEDVSSGAAPKQSFIPWSKSPDFADSRAIIYDGNAYPNMQLKKHPLYNPSVAVSVGIPVTFGFPGAITIKTSNNLLYVNDQLAPFTLYTVDTTTGVRTTVANCSGIAFANLTGITWDPAHSIMYGCYTNFTLSGIFSINTTTGVSTAIGTASTICAGAISISSSATGTLFVVDIVADNLYKVNRTTGVFTLVGPLGVNANFGQDAQFELGGFGGSSKLYWAAYTTGPQLRLLDTSTGSSTLIGSYSGQTCGIGIYVKYVGFNEVKDVNVNVYPNPATTVVNIEANNIETYKVMNVAGQVIDEVVVNNNNAQINVSNYDAGVYIVQVKTNNGLITKKITVAK